LLYAAPLLTIVGTITWILHNCTNAGKWRTKLFLFLRFAHRWGAYGVLAIAHVSFVTGMSDFDGSNRMYLIMIHIGGSFILLGSLEYYKRIGHKKVVFKEIRDSIE
jgi:hypothetical protein